jgi:predicted ABC-type ATPase
MRPTLTVLAGPNGAGKSYFSDYFVQTNLISTQPVNIDALEAQIDKSRIPNDPLRYGIEVIKAIDKVFQSLCQNAILNNNDFSFECNLRKDQLSSVNLFEQAGYQINIIYIWLDNIAISEERVNLRVSEGGHPVGLESIKRNFKEGLQNLDLSVAENHWNHVYIIDNSKDIKHKGNPLSLLIEIDNKKVIQISSEFLSKNRQVFLPKICNNFAISTRI